MEVYSDKIIDFVQCVVNDERSRGWMEVEGKRLSEEPWRCTNRLREENFWSSQGSGVSLH